MDQVGCRVLILLLTLRDNYNDFFFFSQQPAKVIEALKYFIQGMGYCKPPFQFL